MNSITRKLIYTKKRICRAFILQIVCLVFLFTGYSIYAQDKCDYQYIIFTNYRPAHTLSSEFSCRWCMRNEWAVVPVVCLKVDGCNNKSPKMMWFQENDAQNNKNCWNIKIDRIIDCEPHVSGKGRQSYPMYMRIKDNKGLNLDYSKCTLLLTYENLVYNYYAKFGANNFKGTLNENLSETTYSLSNFQWINEPNHLGVFLLQAEINPDATTMPKKKTSKPSDTSTTPQKTAGQPAVETNNKQTPPDDYKPVANQPSQLNVNASRPPETQVMEEVKTEQSNTHEPATSNPESTRESWGIQDTLIIISDGTTMCERKWFGIAREAVFNLVSDSDKKLKNQTITLVSGCDADMDVIMHNSTIGSDTEEIKKALQKAAFSKKKIEYQRLLKMLLYTPAIIDTENLIHPNVIILVSVEWSFFDESDLNNLGMILNTLFENSCSLTIVNLKQDEKDRCGDFERFLGEIKVYKKDYKIEKKEIILSNEESDKVKVKKIRDELKELLITNGRHH